MNFIQPLQNMTNNSFTQTNLIRSTISSLDKLPVKPLPVTSMKDYPIESYALPSWFGSYLPEKATLSTELYSFWEFVGKLSEENNIDSREEYYQNVILDKKNSDKLHTEMDARLKNTPRVLELMDILLL